MRAQNQFENDVISYGSQTAALSFVEPSKFENDVISYGSQTVLKVL